MKLTVLLMLAIGSAAWAETGAELFQKAVVEERASGNLEEAIKIYQRVAREFPKDCALAAKALLQAARCYEKLGQDKAVNLYEQVAREYGDQREPAATARQRLAAITGGTAAKAGISMSARRIPIPPSAFVVQSDGRHVFYVDRAGGGLMSAGMDGANPRLILPLGGNRRTSIPASPTISPDGKLIAFNLGSLDRNTFCVVGTDGSGFRELYDKPLHGVQPNGGWSPDGRSFIGHLLESDGSYTVATISVEDGSIRKISNDPAVRGSYALALWSGGGFSPDGKYIFFAARPSAGLESDIHIVAVDGSYRGKLIEHPSMNLPIGFAPDGKHFIFQSDRSGRAGIYAVRVENGRAQGEPVLIKQEPGISENGTSFTRNGTFFYTLGEQAVHEAFTLNLDPATGKAVGSPQLLSGPAGLTPESAAWSPDGQKLAFIAGRNHQHGGGDVTLTVRTLASGQDASWKMPPETEAVVGWSTDGSAVYTAVRYGLDRMELHSVSTTAGESRTLAVIPGTRVIHCVRPAPGGNALLISYGDQPPVPGRPAGVIRQDLRTGQQTEIIAKGVVSEATLSPDGKQVAALDRDEKSATIMVKPLEGGDWKTLATLEGAGYMYLHWLPNGDLMFGKEGLPHPSLFRLAAAGGTPEKVGDLTTLDHVHEIRVHPDGRKLLLQSYVSHVEFWALENFLPKEYMAP